MEIKSSESGDKTHEEVVNIKLTTDNGADCVDIKIDRLTLISIYMLAFFEDISFEEKLLQLLKEEESKEEGEE